MARPPAPPPVSACTPCSEAQERLQNCLRPDLSLGSVLSPQSREACGRAAPLCRSKTAPDDGPSAPMSLPKPHFPATTPAPPTWGLGSEQASHSLTPVFTLSCCSQDVPLPRPSPCLPLPCCQPDVTCSSPSKSCFKEVGGGVQDGGDISRPMAESH